MAEQKPQLHHGLSHSDVAVNFSINHSQLGKR